MIALCVECNCGDESNGVNFVWKKLQTKMLTLKFLALNHYFPHSKRLPTPEVVNEYKIEKTQETLSIEDLLLGFPRWMLQYAPFFVFVKATDIYFTLIIVSS